ncbi:MAG TPA: hypothetical protein PKJ02_06360, partial [Candidatus Avimonas sp.]|nr:hypothetical protein [Candidatus Avimonas sp.]
MRCGSKISARTGGIRLIVLVINSGSSSLKYQLFNMQDRSVMAKGICECIGTGGRMTHKRPGMENYTVEVPLPTH